MPTDAYVLGVLARSAFVAPTLIGCARSLQPFTVHMRCFILLSHCHATLRTRTTFVIHCVHMLFHDATGALHCALEAAPSCA